MKKVLFLLVIFCGENLYAQGNPKLQKKTIIGVIDPNISFRTKPKFIKYTALPLFIKGENGWQAVGEDDLPQHLSLCTGYNGQSFGCFFSGKLYGNSANIPPAEYAVKSNQYKKIGKPTQQFTSMQSSNSSYRPLVFNTQRFFKQKSKLLSVNFDQYRDVIYKYIRDTCLRYGLEVSHPDSVFFNSGITSCHRDTMGNVLIVTDVNFDFYSFERRAKYTVSEIDNLSIGKRTVFDTNFSPGCCFSIKDGKVTLVGFRMRFLDYGDYDDNCGDEYVFKTSGYNYDGYILLSNDMATAVQVVWSYH